ncbi:MAG TPA: hypothetical protein VI670_11385 [Thermoanaerobaculia bacterium]|jgi:hypothetical protein
MTTTPNWQSGQLIQNFGAGNTYTCTALVSGEIYGVFFYNNGSNPVTVQVVTANSSLPAQIQVPGASDGQGLASVALVSGNDTTSVSVSISSNQSGASLSTWICSVGLPTTIVAPMTNAQLPDNGTTNNFSNYNRYYSTPPSDWQEVTIESQIDQFISLQFTEGSATVNIVNPVPNATASIYPLGTVAIGGPSGASYSLNLAPSTSPQTIQYDFAGNGQQTVWMNADSPQDSSGATISLQPLEQARKRRGRR